MKDRLGGYANRSGATFRLRCVYTQLRCQVCKPHRTGSGAPGRIYAVIQNQSKHLSCSTFDGDADLLVRPFSISLNQQAKHFPKTGVFSPFVKKSTLKHKFGSAGQGGVAGWGETTKPGDVWAKQGNQQLREGHLPLTSGHSDI